MSSWASLVLRLCLGAIFIGHGMQKAFGLFGGPGISGFAKFLQSLGFTPVGLWAYIAAYIELLSGICLVLGLFTRTASWLLIALMLVATYKVHLSKGLFLANGGFEYNLLIIGSCIVLVLLGAGKYSLGNKL